MMALTEIQSPTQENTLSITLVDREGNEQSCEAYTDMGLNLMELMKACELPVQAICDGMGLCGSCHVHIQSSHVLSEPSEAEEMTLDSLPEIDVEKSRLACQIPLTPDLDGLVVALAPE